MAGYKYNKYMVARLNREHAWDKEITSSALHTPSCWCHWRSTIWGLLALRRLSYTLQGFNNSVVDHVYQRWMSEWFTWASAGSRMLSIINPRHLYSHLCICQYETKSTVPFFFLVSPDISGIIFGLFFCTLNGKRHVNVPFPSPFSSLTLRLTTNAPVL